MFVLFVMLLSHAQSKAWLMYSCLFLIYSSYHVVTLRDPNCDSLKTGPLRPFWHANVVKTYRWSKATFIVMQWFFYRIFPVTIVFLNIIVFIAIKCDTIYWCNIIILKGSSGSESEWFRECPPLIVSIGRYHLLRERQDVTSQSARTLYQFVGLFN